MAAGIDHRGTCLRGLFWRSQLQDEPRDHCGDVFFIGRNRFRAGRDRMDGFPMGETREKYLDAEYRKGILNHIGAGERFSEL